MKKLFINTIALEDSAVIRKSKNIRLVGLTTVLIGVLITVVGETISDKRSLKIHAVNNEAADLIEELDNIWVMQQK